MFRFLYGAPDVPAEVETNLSRDMRRQRQRRRRRMTLAVVVFSLVTAVGLALLLNPDWDGAATTTHASPHRK